MAVTTSIGKLLLYQEIGLLGKRRFMPLMTCRARRLPLPFLVRRLAFRGYSRIAVESMNTFLQTLVDTTVAFSTSCRNMGCVQHGSLVGLAIDTVGAVAIGA